MASLILIGANGPADDDYIKLSTKKGNRIPNEQGNERNPEALRAAEEIWRTKFPNIRTRSLSATYNCVGLVFGVRRTCIDPKHISMILEDDEYKRLSHENQIQRGDLVLYSKNNEYTHIGIVIQKEADVITASFNITILSQWGKDGEYFHLVQDVPEDYGKWEFWTERKPIK